MTEENTFRKTTPVPTHDSAAGQSVSASTESTVDFAMLEPRDQHKTLLQAEMKDKPFSELSAVLFDHRGASIVGHILLDTLEEAGYSVDDFDAVGALTAAAVPLVSAMIQAAASRGEDLDGFVMDFVYPSIKGPSIAGKRVVLVDSWLSEKSYVQTSSLVTLRNGNELSLDFSVVEHEGANVVAVASMVGGLGGDDLQIGFAVEVQVVGARQLQHLALGDGVGGVGHRPGEELGVVVAVHQPRALRCACHVGRITGQAAFDG